MHQEHLKNIYLFFKSPLCYIRLYALPPHPTQQKTLIIKLIINKTEMFFPFVYECHILTISSYMRHKSLMYEV